MGTANAPTEAEHTGENAYAAGTDSIEAFFANSVILVTGATGFVGKALLEKLLRSCPRIAEIVVLIRAKKGQTVKERFEHLLKNTVFDRLRRESPDVFRKLQPMEGDVSLPDLGLSTVNRNIIATTVNIVFHSAASIRFDDPLKVSVNLNAKGTDRILDLCRSMKNLVSLIHVSTAYSNADRQEITESVYASKLKPDTVIDICENLDNETMNMIEKKLLSNHPNTYTFAKNLAEQIILTKGSDLPIAIVRPSIVCAAMREPFPGWVDNICGVTGIMMEIGRGTVRSVVCDSNLMVDMVPVDYVVDTLICAAWHSTMQNSNSIKVYNCTSSGINPIRWGEFGLLIRKYAIESPSKYVMWYPSVFFTTNKFLHNFISATLHFLPAFMVDLILRFQGAEPTMMKVTKRFERAVKTGEFFATHEWHFHRLNMNDLMKKVNALKDGNRFNVDIRSLNWDRYIKEYTLGIRKYILNDNPESLNKARVRLLKLYWMHRFTQLISVYVLLKIVKRAGR